jgi:hypothetical protein
MSIIILLTLIHALLIHCFYHLRTLRAERRVLIQILGITAIFILFNKFITPLFQGDIQQFFSCSIGLILASFSSLYLRQVIVESRTSIYLVFLALFPFTLFYIFYIFHFIYDFELYKGDVYAILDFFFIKAQSGLLLFTIVYDIILLTFKSKTAHPIVASIDGQLAHRLFYIKLFILSTTVISALLYDLNAWHSFSETIYATMILLILVYFVKGKKLLFRKNSKIWDQQSTIDYDFMDNQSGLIQPHINHVKKLAERKFEEKRYMYVNTKRLFSMFISKP